MLKSLLYVGLIALVLILIKSNLNIMKTDHKWVKTPQLTNINNVNLSQPSTDHYQELETYGSQLLQNNEKESSNLVRELNIKYKYKTPTIQSPDSKPKAVELEDFNNYAPIIPIQTPMTIGNHNGKPVFSSFQGTPQHLLFQPPSNHDIKPFNDNTINQINSFGSQLSQSYNQLSTDSNHAAQFSTFDELKPKSGIDEPSVWEQMAPTFL